MLARFYMFACITASALALGLAGCDRTQTVDEEEPLISKHEPCDMNAYCRSLAGPTSYCKNWQTISTCLGADDITQCSTCGHNASEPLTSLSPTSSIQSSKPTTSTPPATTTIYSKCEDPPTGNPVPSFLWVEGTRLYSESDFVSFFRRLSNFIQSNCVSMGVTTLVVRTPNPVYPTQSAEPAFWPPENSALYTEVIAKVKSPLRILLYPYIMEDFDRNAWFELGDKPGVFEGIFSFTKAWQDFVEAHNPVVAIEGFMIDYEEIYRAMGSEHRVTLTPDSLNPYRLAYPTVKTATTVGYDDTKTIAYFYPFMDYIHLQVYDLYYPYEGSDESSKDSIFVQYQDDPEGLVEVLAQHVFLPGILKAYSGKESKLKLMWSTQTLGDRNCLYPLNDGRCGINYEFDWKPRTFNEFLKLVISHPVLGSFEHGVYPYNFMRQDWLVPADRSPY